MKRFFVLSLVTLLSMSAFAQIDLSKEFPLDPKIRVGKLPNGLTYYIRHNEEPMQRASFYIMRHAGALLENDDQDGLAHFLEHMSFNGTKNFPDKGIIKTLERHGVSFGGNINAYTAQDETVYNLSDIPTQNDKLMDTCLFVLRDWANYLTLAEAEIDSERGVIGEEWRTRNSSGSRMRNKVNAVLFEGSQYAKRDVIGDFDIIKNFKYQTLRDFYHDWYRTDLSAIAVVGDIDVDAMEAKIKATFTELPAVKNPKPRPIFEIPARNDIGYVLATDKEATSSNLAIYMLYPDKSVKNTIGTFKSQTVEGFYNGMLDDRVGEVIQNGNPYLLRGGASVSDLVPMYRTDYIGVVSKPNLEAEALEAVYVEVERARRHGFTQSELDRAKSNTLTQIDSYYKQKDRISNEDYINEIKTLFIDNNIPMDIEVYYPMAKEVIASITLDDVNAVAKNAFKKENMVITITGPESGVKHATKEEVLAVMDKVEKSKIDKYIDNVGGESLIDKDALKGSAIVKTKKLPVCNAVEWTLANGAKVVFANADYDKNSVKVTGFSDGGTSLYGVDMLPTASFTPSLVGGFGLGDFDAIALGKMLSGKQAGTGVSINSLGESVSGESSPEDFETMMQMMYMRFEKPRFDAKVFNSIMDRQRSQLAQKKNDPMSIVRDSATMISTNYNPRSILVDEDVLNKITIENIEKIYRDRIQNASEFTFIIVGNIEESVVKPMVEKYIGSISTNSRKETWKDNKVRCPKGITEKVITIPFNTPKAMVSVGFQKEMKYSRKTSLEMNVLTGIMDLRYTENIREKEGGTYGVGVSSSVSKKPVNRVAVNISFDCDPDKADHLKSLVYKEIESIKNDGVTALEVENVVKNMIKNREQSKSSNGYIMNVVANYVDEKVDMDDPKNFNDILNKMTPADIKKLANKVFDKKADVIDVMFTSKK